MMELNLVFKSLNGPRKNATCHELNIVLFDSCISFRIRYLKVKGSGSIVCILRPQTF